MNKLIRFAVCLVLSITLAGPSPVYGQQKKNRNFKTTAKKNPGGERVSDVTRTDVAVKTLTASPGSSAQMNWEKAGSDYWYTIQISDSNPVLLTGEVKVTPANHLDKIEQIALVQNVFSHREKQHHDGTACVLDTGNYVMDQVYVDVGGTFVDVDYPEDGVIRIRTSDAPRQALSRRHKKLIINDAFKVYLQYKLKGEDAWRTAGMIDWTLNGQAEKMAGNTLEWNGILGASGSLSAPYPGGDPVMQPRITTSNFVYQGGGACPLE